MFSAKIARPLAAMMNWELQIWKNIRKSYVNKTILMADFTESLALPFLIFKMNITFGKILNTPFL